MNRSTNNKQKINFAMKDLLSDLEEYDAKLIRDANLKEEQLFQQKEMIEREKYPPLTIEEENKIMEYFADKFYCNCCSLDEMEMLIGRNIKPCKDCYCCMN